MSYLRIAQCDLTSVLAAATAVAAERALLAAQRGRTLSDVAWASVGEIVRDRGVPPDVAWGLAEHAVSRGLLQRVPDRGVAIIDVGQAHLHATLRR